MSDINNHECESQELRPTTKGIEEKYQSVMENAFKELSVMLDEVQAKLYTEYLPYVVDDLDSNVRFIVSSILDNILAGNIERKGDLLYVKDQNNVSHLISSAVYRESVLEALANAAPDVVKDNYIKVLEAKIARLKDDLDRAYGRY